MFKVYHYVLGLGAFLFLGSYNLVAGNTPKKEFGRISAMSLTSAATCAVFENGKVACVGYTKGLTDEFALSTKTPTAAEAEALALPVAIKQLSVSDGSRGRHACALTLDNRVICWGANSKGEAGPPAEESILQKLAEKQGIPLKKIKKLRPLTTPAEISLSQVPSQVVTGVEHSCALTSNGDVWCWGDNVFGQLGFGRFPDGKAYEKSAVPVRVTLLTAAESKAGLKAVQIACGRNHTCALLSDGNVRCWGDNYFGQAGYPPHTEGLIEIHSVGTITTPAQEGNIEIVTSAESKAGLRVQSIAAGSDRSCAILTSGVVRCWGENRSRKLGLPADFDKISVRNTPASLGNVPLPPNIVRLALNDIHTCALTSTGAVHCWGSNSNGQLGVPGYSVGAYGEMPPPAVKILSPQENDTVVDIGVGTSHTCALLKSGKMRCWGLAFDGQLGTGSGKRFGSAGCMNNQPYCIGDEESELPPPDVGW